MFDHVGVGLKELYPLLVGGLLPTQQLVKCNPKIILVYTSYLKKEWIFACRAKIEEEDEEGSSPDEPRILLQCFPLLVEVGGNSSLP